MEGSYKLNRLPQTAEETEAGTITNPQSLETDKKSENSESRHSKIFVRRLPSFSKNFYEYFVEYANNTTIQGIRYMGEQSRPIVERLAWLIFFCISLYICIELTIKSYRKWETSPVLISFATSPTPIWKIPFPAITICPDTKTRKSVFNYMETERKLWTENGTANVTDEEKKHFNELGLICGGFVLFGGNETTIGYDAIEFLKKTAPEFNQMMLYCIYLASSNEAFCPSSFTPILTQAGICYTYNMIDRRKVFRDNVFQFFDFKSHGNDSGGWTLEGGYKENAPIETYPKRAIASGIGSSFYTTLVTKKQDLDYACNRGVQGYQISLHHPAESPRFDLNYFHVSFNQEMEIQIKPNMMTTSKDLRNYDPRIRQCYYPEERYLEFYRIYTQQHCEIECLTNFTKTQCGCVAFHMPHKNGTLLCGSDNKECMRKAKRVLERKKIQSIMDKEKTDPNGPSMCDCLPGCVSLTYNAELSHIDRDFEKEKEFYSWTDTMKEDNLLSFVAIYFKEEEFITLERNELYGSTDFLSSCGGILGLFTGFSFLSLVEILYFLSLRLLCNVKRYGRHYWSGSQELVNSDKYEHKK